jgi:hypothetical protein
MAFLSNADGLILDLRTAVGGDPGMAALLTGYLVGPEPVLMSASRYRSGRVEQYWSPKLRTGSLHPLQSKPLYILTSDLTFSAGEYLPFVLKARNRAVVVGEKTGGGAYGGHTVELSPQFAAWISISRPVVPGVQGDWEARGVTPHITAPAQHAVLVAHADLLRTRASGLPLGANRTELEWIAERLLVQVTPVQLSHGDLRPYVGVYGDRVVTLGQGGLLHRRGDGIGRRLIPLGSDTFALEGYDPFRLKFIRDGGPRIVALEATAPGGEPVRQVRTE